MSIAKRYKQTEVGVIPEDWEVKCLGDIGIFSKGSGVRKDQSYSGELPCVRYGELYTKHYYYIKKFYSFISVNISKEAKRLKNGDILFAGSGETKSEIGKSVAFINDFEAYAGGDIVILSPTGIDSLYLGYLLNAPFIQSQKASKGQGDAVVHISSNSLGAIKIPLPPLHEQTAIANALSDMDALIAQTEKLIEKKKAIKQGVMQELLQPKEGWVTKKLGEVCEILDNIRKPLNDSQRQDMKGDIPYCGANGIVGYVNDFLIDDDIILMAEDGGYFDEYKTRPIAYRFTGKCWVNNHVHILKSKKEYDQDFVFYSLVHKNILDFINGGTRAKLNKSEMLNITINIPLNKYVQTKIADTINEIGDYLYKAETKLQKRKNQKQGMMQALLTGKIRLV